MSEAPLRIKHHNIEITLILMYRNINGSYFSKIILKLFEINTLLLLLIAEGMYLSSVIEFYFHSFRRHFTTIIALLLWQNQILRLNRLFRQNLLPWLNQLLGLNHLVGQGTRLSLSNLVGGGRRITSDLWNYYVYSNIYTWKL